MTDENKTFTVVKIIGQYPAQYEKTRVVFTTNETGETQLSGFFKFVPQEGKTVFGRVTTNEKDGRTYNNFTPAPAGGATRTSAPAPTANPAEMVMVNRKLDAIWTKLGVIQGILVPDETKTAFDEPEEVASEAVAEEEEIDPESIPF